MDKQVLTPLLLRQFESKFASTFFINGPPGSGKTYLLNELAASLPAYTPNTQVLGPYHSSLDQISASIVDDFLGLGYLNSPAPQECQDDWYSTWFWLKDHLKVSGRQNFLILIRLNDNNFSECDHLRSGFSSLRYMEDYWNNAKVRLLLVVAGYWNHVSLEEHYRTIQLSFPYTTSTNYLLWNRISQNETIELVRKNLDVSALTEAFGKLIHEITGGLPGAIMDVLAFLKSPHPSMRDVIAATRLAAEEGEYGKALVKSWLQCPPSFTQLIEKLLLYRRLNSSDKNAIDLLNIAGIISAQELAGRTFIQIRSWYIELVLRNNAKMLGLDTRDWQEMQFNEFAPGLSAFNLDAYKIINSIENLIRNFAIARLSEQDCQDEHILQNKVVRRKKSSYTNEDDDIYDRAYSWRKRSRENGMDVSLNPLITYVSTGDLVELIREIAIQGDPFWDEIVSAIEKVAPIRDAVMHHQMIDEKNLESLYDVQVKIYSALNR